MARKKLQDKDPMIQHLSQLIGRRIVQLAVSGGADEFDRCYGLILDDGKVPNMSNKCLVAWIQCDPEGNGPGFLAIEPHPEVVKGCKEG